MVIEILIIMTMFLWFLSLLPPAQPYAWAGGWLMFIWAVLITLFLFVPGLR